MPESEVAAVKSKYLALCALFAALTAVCAWLSIPMGAVTFTMQSFAVSLCLLLLGGKWGSVSVFVYLLLGLVGLPVFSGFRGGAGMLIGPTGGFLMGFPIWALAFWGITAIFGKKSRLPALITGQILCYLCGALWMAAVYTKTGILEIMLTGVIPYLLPDALKITLAWLLAKRLKHRIS